MSIKYFANRVKETTTTSGSGNLVLGGSTSGYKTFVSAIGGNKTLTYHIYRLDTNSEWEIGVGYILESGGLDILVREEVISSSNNNTFVSFTEGTKFIESIISQDRINTSLLNVVNKSGNFTPDYMSALYIIDASLSGVQVSLPAVSSETNPLSMSFLLNKTSGNVYDQPNAIVLVPSGTETINGSSSYDITIKNDYLNIVAIPSQSGWFTLDPYQDSTNPYGEDGSVQVKYSGAFSGISSFNWDFTNSSLLIGGTGTIGTASIIFPASSGGTVVFNEQSASNDFRVEGNSNTHLLFIDGSENKVAINSSNANDSLAINAQYGNGLTIYRSGVGPKIVIGNTSVSGLATNDIVGTIIFSGLNDSGSSVEYTKIYSKINDTTDSSEYSSINIEVMRNGSLEEIANFGTSGIIIGSNNSNVSGIIVGEVCQNDGDNVVLGYYQNICGNNCISIGHSGILYSGTFGGLIGTKHEASGNNIWVVGGSGVLTSGNNQTYVAVNNNSYLKISTTGTYFSNKGLFPSGIQTPSIITETGNNSITQLNSESIVLNYISTPTGAYITPEILPTGSSEIYNLLYQTDAGNSLNNSTIRYEAITKSGDLASSLQLNANDAEYQFLFPTGSGIVYLPNGTGLYLGKKFYIYNLNTTGNSISVRKSGSLTTIETIVHNRHMGIVHAGDDNWLRIVSSGIN